MNRIRLFGLVGLLAAGMLLAVPGGKAQEKKPDEKKADPHHGAFMECARACDDCARMCDACGAHCTDLVASGKKEHLTTLKTCQDCAAICRTASALTARQGPFSDTICIACADACKRCGDSCEKFKDDEMMKKCMEECRKCEKACREMLKHTGGKEK
jgi:hypothetical protein